MSSASVEPTWETGPRVQAKATVAADNPTSKTALRREITKLVSPIGRKKTRQIDVVGFNERHYTVRVPHDAGTSGVAVTVSLSPPFDGRHTISWDEPIELPLAINGERALLPAGECNLFKYPMVQLKSMREGKLTAPHLPAFYVLDQLLLALLLDEAGNGYCDDQGRTVDFANRFDVTGALPQHGLLVSNTPASVEVVLKAFRARPALIPLGHAKGLFFAGENSLHILAVNSREMELMEVIWIAARNLKRKQLKKTFTAPARGGFFLEEPMLFYGGSAVSYAVAFELEGAIRQMLIAADECPEMEGVIDLNEPAHACPLTGFLPIHVAVANSLTSMFNFLIDLPGMAIQFDPCCAMTSSLSVKGIFSRWSALSPLQLATKLGDRRMVQYIMRSQSVCDWQWGPVSEWHINLDGIDSVGQTGNDVLELLGMLDASAETQKMLLDDFVAGIFHELFVQKFMRFGRKVFMWLRMMDILFLFTLYAIAVWLKTRPASLLAPHGALRYTHLNDTLDVVEEEREPWVAVCASYLPYVGFGLILPMLEEDLRAAYLWWASRRARGRGVGSSSRLSAEETLEEVQRGLWGCWRDLSTLLRWMQSHGMPLKFTGWVFSSIAFVGVLTEHGRPEPSIATDDADMMRIFIALGATLHTMVFFRSVLAPFENLGILYNTVFKMLGRDVTYWLVLFIIFLVNYGLLLMWITYPHFGTLGDSNRSRKDGTPVAFEPMEALSGFTSALWALFQLAFIGEPIEVDLVGILDQIGSPQVNGWKSTAILFSLASYVVYIIMALVLLLNLLIAMMGDTYAEMQESAVLAWRVDYARRVLRLELQVRYLHRCGLVSLNCGEKKVSDKGEVSWVLTYKQNSSNTEGGGSRGIKKMFDDAIQEEADEDQEDDYGPGGSDGGALTTDDVTVTACNGSAVTAPTAVGKKVKQKKAKPRKNVSLRGVVVTSAVVVGQGTGGAGQGTGEKKKEAAEGGTGGAGQGTGEKEKEAAGGVGDGLPVVKPPPLQDDAGEGGGDGERSPVEPLEPEDLETVQAA